MAHTPSLTDIEYIEIHGERTAYRHSGSGEEVVVLLHGMAGSSDSWRDVIAVLAGRYRVIAPDLLGHGRSDKPRSDYSLGAFAASLRDLLDELDVQRATLVGHSLGGGIAMQFLYQHPEYCQRLVLVSSGGLGPDVGWILRLLSAPGTEFVLPLLAPKPLVALGNTVRSWLGRTRLGSPRAEQSWQAYSSLSDGPTRSAFLHTLRSVVDYRGQSVSALSKLRLRAEIPTLVIWGDQDAVIPVEHGYQVEGARPNSTLTVLPGLGHFPHVEAPAEVAAAIDDFIIDSRGEHAAHRVSPTVCGVGFDADLPEVVMEQRSIIESLVKDLEARQQVEVAVGLLMGLRGCAHIEAANEFRAAVDETGIPAEDLARALVTQAGTDNDAPAALAHTGATADPGEQVQQRWGALLAARGLDDEYDTATIPADTRISYGPENESTLC